MVKEDLLKKEVKSFRGASSIPEQLEDSSASFIPEQLDFPKDPSETLEEYIRRYSKASNAILVSELTTLKEDMSDSGKKNLALKEDLRKLSRNQENLSKQQDKLSGKQESILTDLRNDRFRTIETVSIFVAFLAFVASGTQLFKKDWPLISGAGFTLVLLGSVMIFPLLIHLLLKSLTANTLEDKNLNKQNGLLNALFILSIIFIVVGTCLASFKDIFRGINKSKKQNSTITDATPSAEIKLPNINNKGGEEWLRKTQKKD